MPESRDILVPVKVVVRARKNEVVDEDGGVIVRTTASPTDGQANQAVIALIAEYFNVAKSRVKILRGLRSRRKVIAIA